MSNNTNTNQTGYSGMTGSNDSHNPKTDITIEEHNGYQVIYNKNNKRAVLKQTPDWQNYSYKNRQDIYKNIKTNEQPKEQVKENKITNMIKLKFNDRTWTIDTNANINNSIVHCINKYCKENHIEPVSIDNKDNQIFVTYNYSDEYKVLMFELIK